MRGGTLVVIALSVPAILTGAPASGVGTDAPDAPGAVATPPKVAVPPTPAAPPSAEELRALVREAQRVQRVDAAAWAGYRFRRTARSERLAAGGAVEQASLLEFDVTPTAGNGFDERLVAIDGRASTGREVEEHRGAARFTRHYRTLSAGKDEQDMESGYSLSTLLRLSAYRYVGLEDIDGVPAHRLDFEPDPVAGGGSVAARITQAMSGSLWLTADGLHLVRARAATGRPVSLFLGLSRVRSLEVGLEAAAVAPGVYLPREVTIVTHARILFAAIHRRQVFTYFDFGTP
jgi:hypothetical protein